jgi:hypothetical protein
MLDALMPKMTKPLLDIGGIAVSRSYPDIDEVTPLSDADAPCIEEIKSVLERHGALQRFGLCLLHDHFEVADDEVLVERVDPINRVLVSQPEHVEALADVASIETSWRLDSATALTACRSSCVPGANGSHGQIHMNP